MQSHYLATYTINFQNKKALRFAGRKPKVHYLIGLQLIYLHYEQNHVNLVITDFLTNLYEYDQVNGRTYDKKNISW